MIPLNAITPLVGAPVVIYVIVNQKRISIFQLMERRCVITGERLSIGYRLGGRGVRRVHEGRRFRCVPAS